MVRLIVAVLPLALVPVLMHLLAGGQIALGGGEKDLVWALAWLLWSLLYGISSFVLWQRGWPLWQSALSSAVAGLVGVALAAAILAAFGQLGVAAASGEPSRNRSLSSAQRYRAM